MSPSSAVAKQLKQKKSSSQAQHHLPALDLLSDRVQLTSLLLVSHGLCASLSSATGLEPSLCITPPWSNIRPPQPFFLFCFFLVLFSASEIVSCPSYFHVIELYQEPSHDPPRFWGSTFCFWNLSLQFSLQIKNLTKKEPHICLWRLFPLLLLLLLLSLSLSLRNLICPVILPSILSRFPWWMPAEYRYQNACYCWYVW